MSKRTSAASVPNKKRDSSFANLVLPTPDGPMNRKTPIGRLGALSPAMAARKQRLTTATALSCPMTRDDRLLFHLRITLLLVRRELATPGCPSHSATTEGDVGGGYARASFDHRPGARDVNGIDRLVGLIAVLNGVFVRQGHRRTLQRLLGDHQTLSTLRLLFDNAWSQFLQNCQSRLRRQLFDEHR